MGTIVKTKSSRVLDLTPDSQAERKNKLNFIKVNICYASRISNKIEEDSLQNGRKHLSFIACPKRELYLGIIEISLKINNSQNNQVPET